MLRGHSVVNYYLDKDDIGRSFLIADTHFDHANIIRYCHRPFRNVKEMNLSILRNWRRAIKKDSLVFFIGDMSYGRGSRSVSWWLKRLTGRIIYLRGNHELGKIVGGNLLSVADALILNADGLRFYLTHDPCRIPVDWQGWAIHGHKHDTRAFIDKENRHICVSVEAINYQPVNLAELLRHVEA